MRKGLKVLLALGFVMLLILSTLAGCAQPAPAPKPTPTPAPAPKPTATPTPAPPKPSEIVRLVFQASYPGSSGYTKAFAWAETVEKYTNGRIRMMVVPGRGGLEAAQRVADGLSNIGGVGPSTSYASWMGLKPFAKPYHIRALGA